jgi:hypothetical protein
MKYLFIPTEKELVVAYLKPLLIYLQDGKLSARLHGITSRRISVFSFGRGFLGYETE